MRLNFLLFTCMAMFLMVNLAHARIWRVNNNAGVATDFTTFDACVGSASVLNGDTVHLEPSTLAYANNNLINKRLTFIGTGYFLSGAAANTGLQANTTTAFFSGALRFDSLASGSRFLGIDINTDLWLDPRADNIRFERCRFNSISWNVQAASTSNRAQNLVFNKCHFTGAVPPAQFYYDNLEITNCIVAGTTTFGAGNISNALIRNNVFLGGVTLTNTYFANNILLNIGAGSFNVTFSTVRNNIAQFTGVLPTGNGNQAGFSQAALFVGLTGNSTDGQWQLLAGSPAIGAGETVSGITPDCGAFGTADPYRLSGIPPVPTIYSLTVPGTVGVGQPLNITVSTRSNN
jgi:hypothetical protein